MLPKQVGWLRGICCRKKRNHHRGCCRAVLWAAIASHTLLRLIGGCNSVNCLATCRFVQNVRCKALGLACLLNAWQGCHKKILRRFTAGFLKAARSFAKNHRNWRRKWRIVFRYSSGCRLGFSYTDISALKWLRQRAAIETPRVREVL